MVVIFSGKSEHIALWDIVLHKVRSGPVSNGALNVYLCLAGPMIPYGITPGVDSEEDFKD